MRRVLARKAPLKRHGEPSAGRAQAVTHDDRTALYGALLGVADLLKGADGPEMLTLWRRRGRRTFG